MKFRNMIRKYAGPASTGVVLLGASQFANAAIDVTAVTTAVGDAAAPIAAIGAAVLLVLVGVKTWKWIRRAM